MGWSNNCLPANILSAAACGEWALMIQITLSAGFSLFTSAYFYIPRILQTSLLIPMLLYIYSQKFTTKCAGITWMQSNLLKKEKPGSWHGKEPYKACYITRRNPPKGRELPLPWLSWTLTGLSWAPLNDNPSWENNSTDRLARKSLTFL